MRAIDLLASGIHDANNQLFSAESLIAAAEAQHGIDLGEARFAIQATAGRLNQTLASYRQPRHETRIALIPTARDAHHRPDRRRLCRRIRRQLSGRALPHPQQHAGHHPV
ncbi:hypothetical protein [Dechloromonas sp.]|uniref:hypothetical protein n=1 Tax=Dechloromonas sp. TaxID=1917218 RepID=UPI00217024F4|nr:hypothetical protein [Dechloromonas sp.]MBU3695105.1 hypothetical protein [Dechloromonas sp.]